MFGCAELRVLRVEERHTQKCQGQGRGSPEDCMATEAAACGLQGAPWKACCHWPTDTST